MESLSERELDSEAETDAVGSDDDEIVADGSFESDSVPDLDAVFVFV